MTLRQLRYLCEIVRQGMHLSQAAAALHTSQPGVSRQIQLLEQELGVVILRRKRNRIQGLTQEGREVFRLAERTLREAENIRHFGEELRNETEGNLVIATTHTHARYTLPAVITKFAETYPAVRLEFWQGNRDEIFQWVEAGDADLAIGTDSDTPLENVELLPCGQYHRVLVAKPGHSLLKAGKLTLEDIARYPIITYGFRDNRRWKFSPLFEAKKLTPNIVFSAVDADVCKAYVELGLGVAILPNLTFDPARDSNLRSADVSHLFEPEVMNVGVNRTRFHRGYLFSFIELLAPQLPRRKMERLLEAAR